MQQGAEFADMVENDVKKSLDPPVKIEALSDRDAGFCSGEDTDIDTGYHSPTETSQDSTDGKESIHHFQRHGKRKILEPKKEPEEEPKFKQIKVESGIDSSYSDSIKSNPSPLSLVKEEVLAAEQAKRMSPFRPWDLERPGSRDLERPDSRDRERVCSREWVQEEPLALVVDKKKRSRDDHYQSYRLPKSEADSLGPDESGVYDLRKCQDPHEVVRLFEPEHCTDSSDMVPDSSRLAANFSPALSSLEALAKSSHSNANQRNYKNMTRERRIEANARERTRVHTISAAFETLRKCVPSYAHNQKLSKLSVLRIACSYIMTLSRMAGHDLSEDQSQPSLESCVESVCSTIQLEGKTRKKKDE